ncbi:hypothetical protein EDD17DRAFT_1467051 [Pisolithus thermaeus]|nr:hypothetical protein EV401DRAFT_1876049 [Pisolithus croceorrhizus]KAI6168004.1 hypothetical protein EDD17DRAFT_1467051 [Pisolithus thermaeus]
MASQLVVPSVPSLPVWASSRLNSLLKSKTTDRFNRIFDATFAQNVDVVVNGKSLTRDEYKKVLLAQSEAGPLGTTDVQIDGETTVTPSEDRSGGFVGIFYTTVGTSKRIFVLGAPATYKVVSSINLTYVPTVKSTVPYPSARLRYFDARRVTAVNQVLPPRSLIVSFPGSVVPANEASISGKVELGPGPLNVAEGEEVSVLGNKFSTASVPEAEVDDA